MEPNNSSVKVKAFLKEEITTRMDAVGIEANELELKEEDSFFTNGIYDSIALLTLISDIEEEFNIEIDFFNFEIEQLTTIQGLTDVVLTLID